MTLSASLRDASTYVMSFISVSACSGVFVRFSRTVQTCLADVSKNIVGPTILRQKV